jgi:hypothetical protein
MSHEVCLINILKDLSPEATQGLLNSKWVGSGRPHAKFEIFDGAMRYSSWTTGIMRVISHQTFGIPHSDEVVDLVSTDCQLPL